MKQRNKIMVETVVERIFKKRDLAKKFLKSSRFHIIIIIVKEYTVL